MREWLRTSTARLVLAAIIAVAMLAYYDRHRIDVEAFGQDMANQTAVETWEGQRLTAREVVDIPQIVQSLRSRPSDGRRQDLMLWLGNSQLHTINQFQAGDHLAPYWLVADADCGGCVLPVGVSLPNANLQEHLVIAHSVVQQLPVKFIVVGLVFDDLREDGLRSELDQLLTAPVRAALAKTPVGAEILQKYDAARTAGGGEKVETLQGFAQRHIEDWLVDKLGVVLPLWADRANLRVRVLIELFQLRNWVFGIKPTTVRRMIKARQERNMQALSAIVELASAHRIPLLAYVAPIRQDQPLPYDIAAYRAWISDLQRWSKEAGFTLLDLERLVPDNRWGAIAKDEIDFMHFQGAGHRLLANALLPEVRRLIAERRD